MLRTPAIPLLALLAVTPAARAGGLSGLPWFLPAPPTFDDTAVDRLGAFQTPTRLALTPQGDLFVVDTRRGVVAVHDIAGHRVGTLRGLTRPFGVAVRTVSADPDCLEAGRAGMCVALPGRAGGDATPPTELAWVTDAGTGAIQVFQDREPAGRLGTLTLRHPNGLDTSTTAVWAVDSGTHQVHAIGFDGALQLSVGGQGAGPGQLDFPTDVAVDEARGRVYVADQRNGRVSVFGLDGSWLVHWGPPANGKGDNAFFRPSGLAVDGSGRLTVVDNALATATVLNPDGTLHQIVGYQGGRYWTGELQVPIDAATDGVHLYVSSSLDGRVAVFEVDP